MRDRVLVVVVAVLLVVVSCGGDDDGPALGPDVPGTCRSEDIPTVPSAAVELEQAAVDDDDRDAAARYRLGLAQFGSGDVESAVLSFGSATELDNTCAPYFLALGGAHLEAGRPTEAEAPLRTAWELAGDDALVAFSLGLAIGQQGRPEEALEWFDAALAIDPDSVNALVNKGVSLNDLERHQEALDPLARAIELAPDAGLGHQQLAVALRALDRIDEAETAEARAAELGVAPVSMPEPTTTNPTPPGVPQTTTTSAPSAAKLASAEMLGDATATVDQTPIDVLAPCQSVAGVAADTSISGDKVAEALITFETTKDATASFENITAAAIGCLWRGEPDDTVYELTAVLAVDTGAPTYAVVVEGLSVERGDFTELWSYTAIDNNIIVVKLTGTSADDRERLEAIAAAAVDAAT